MQGTADCTEHTAAAPWFAPCITCTMRAASASDDHVESAPVSRASQLAFLRIAAGDAIRAVAMQAHRLRAARPIETAFDDVGFQLEIDARFLIVALRWLHRSCAAASHLADDDALRQAVADFEESVMRAGAKDMRNIWEHRDEYVLGEGQLQRQRRSVETGDRTGPPAPGDSQTLSTWVWSGTRPSMGSLTWGGVAVNFDLALSRAEAMYVTLRETPNRFAAHSQQTRERQRAPAWGRSTPQPS